MTTYKTSTWQEYWSLYDKLILLLKTDAKNDCAAEFSEAKKYATGMTDGLHDFLEAFEKAFIKNNTSLSNEQTEISEYLIDSLRKSLVR